jgi:hypothetical protein
MLPGDDQLLAELWLSVASRRLGDDAGFRRALAAYFWYDTERSALAEAWARSCDDRHWRDLLAGVSGMRRHG